jgi:hypothetical protein
MRFARWVFVVAGLYGVVVVAPLYFLESRISQEQPPPITHPEYFYGFTGITLAWQALFLLIGSDPIRYRPAMPVAVLEKLAFAVAVPILFVQHRVGGQTFGFSMIDAVLGTLFAVSYVRTPRQ